MHFYNHLTSLLILIISINLLDVPSINVTLQSAEQQGVVITPNSMETGKQDQKCERIYFY